MKKVVLITGASSGMGKETAITLAKKGYTVYGAARRVENMKQIIDAGGHAIALDITNEASVKECVEKVISEQGRIDVLWNNAGFGLYGSVEDTSIEDARYQFEVNIFGLANITKEVLPHMRAQKSGRILLTSSMGGKMYTPLGAWYHATKHALEGWGDCLRLETKAFGIDVVIIEPGIIATEFGDVMNTALAERSKGGVYEGMASSINAAVKESYDKGMASPSSVITKLVVKAIEARKPKTRYVAGAMAKPLMFVRKWFGDRFFDTIIMSQVKSRAK